MFQLRENPEKSVYDRYNDGNSLVGHKEHTYV